MRAGMGPDEDREQLLAGVEARERDAPKRLAWLPARRHIDFCDNEASSEEVVAWFDAHLARPAAPA